MVCIGGRIGFASIEKNAIAICIDEFAGTLQRTIDVDARHMIRCYVASAQHEQKYAACKLNRASRKNHTWQNRDSHREHSASKVLAGRDVENTTPL